ncbi:MAG: hypothetical protein LBG31_01965 [Prevotellaceae bacterium]|jgi:hypothetical protein|nr:hypothetical protein [Prevotellaceae bacterium]
MKKNILKTIAAMLILAACFSCGKDDKSCSCGEGNENNEFVSLEGTQWKLAGIMDVETCNLKELEPKDCETCYTIEFNTNSNMAQGKSVRNAILFHISLPLPTPIFIHITPMDYENEDVQLFYDAMETVTSYTVTKNELKMCYNEGRNYLLFRKQ